MVRGETAQQQSMTIASKSRRKGVSRPSPNSEWKLRSSGGLRVLSSSSLANRKWLVHGFSTRPGGASELEIVQGGRKLSERSLNLGLTEWDQRSRVEKNRERFAKSIGATVLK